MLTYYLILSAILLVLLFLAIICFCNKLPVLGFICFVGIGAGVFVGVKNYSKYQDEEIVKLENMITYLEEEWMPLQFKIIRNNNQNIAVELTFLSLDGKPVEREEFELTGNELHLDLQIVKLAEEKYMFYPNKLFSDTIAPENGLNLYNLYEKDGFPEIYTNFEQYLKDEGDSSRVDAYRSAIKDQFAYILNNAVENMDNQYGSAVHDVKGITEFKNGYIYSVVCHPHTGGVEIRRD